MKLGSKPLIPALKWLRLVMNHIPDKHWRPRDNANEIDREYQEMLSGC